MPCRFPGEHSGGKLRGLARGGLQAHTGGAWLGGFHCPSGGMPAPGGICSQRGWWRPSPVTVTAAGGTHPTGMHSCSIMQSKEREYTKIGNVHTKSMSLLHHG